MKKKINLNVILKDRIPFEEWRNSYLSIALYSDGVVAQNGKTYVVDRENARTEMHNGIIERFPDLVEKTVFEEEKKKLQAEKRMKAKLKKENILPDSDTLF